jgi:hypothetical protein
MVRLQVSTLTATMRIRLAITKASFLLIENVFEELEILTV